VGQGSEDRWREPVEPPVTPWVLPDPNDADRVGLVGVGADLAPGTLLAAYRSGLFPMPFGDVAQSETMGWWSPERRAVLPLDGLLVSRSLHKARKQFEIRIDTAFVEVVQACADPRRAGGWINGAIADAYTELHRLGWAHSVEAWSHDGTLAGGLYGVAVGGLFAGESMFFWRTDASKVALVSLVERMEAGGGVLLDCQWLTKHLASLGAIEIKRADYLAWLAKAVALPQLRLR
jgi:leucyl/phenylalanyl-tRNA--protein transferase